MKPRIRFLHLKIELRRLPWWARLRCAWSGTVHVLLHRDGHGQYAVYQISATDPTVAPKEAVGA